MHCDGFSLALLEMKENKRQKRRAAVMAAVMGVVAMATGQEAGVERSDEWQTLPPVRVIGSPEMVRTVAGSAAVLDRAVLEEQNYTNPNRALLRVPGVYVREEDGFGNFPNISLRGVSSMRTSKVTIMEDGILTAPAPYSAPAAYYFPRVGRMDSVEVLKGASQVRFGPQTTGGVINFVSTPVPLDAAGMAKVTYGSHNTWLGHFYYGDTVDTSSGRLGWLVELFGESSDGFRHIERAPGFDNPGNTGFQAIEPMLKLSWEPSAGRPQRWELKLGYTDFEADESYLGLSERDVRANPHRRYASSRFDKITSEQFRSVLSHSAEVTGNVTVDTSVYYNRFTRNWFKLHNISREDGTTVNLSRALMDSGDLAILRSRAPGELRYRHNNRTYTAYGVQSQVNVEFETGAFEHSLDIGARLHYDNAGRDQFEEFFRQDESGRITGRRVGPAHAAGWRKDETTALALYAEDRITVGSLGLKPGIRYEYIDYSVENFLTGASGSRSLHVVAPGMGVTYDFDERTTAFAGVYRGISTPSPTGYINNNLREETSISYEAGLRHLDQESAFGAELVGFFTDFSNLLVIENIGATGSGRSENVGDVDAYGLEMAVSWDPLAARGAEITVPMRLAATYTHATLRSDSDSTDAESIFAGGRKGAQVPHVPEWALSAGIGLHGEKWAVDLSATYVDATFTSASNVDRPTTDARFGKTDAAWIFDLAGRVEILDGLNLIGGVNNLFDNDVLSSRLPHGPRSAAPRTIYAGVQYRF